MRRRPGASARAVGWSGRLDARGGRAKIGALPARPPGVRLCLAISKPALQTVTHLHNARHFLARVRPGDLFALRKVVLPHAGCGCAGVRLRWCQHTPTLMRSWCAARRGVCLSALCWRKTEPRPFAKRPIQKASAERVHLKSPRPCTPHLFSARTPFSAQFPVQPSPACRGACSQSVHETQTAACNESNTGRFFAHSSSCCATRVRGSTP